MKAQSTENVHIRLMIDGHEVEAAVAVPVEAAPRRVLLPILQKLTDTVVGLAERGAAEAGRKVSCRKGCDACCRQMVPISATEAYGLAHLLDGMGVAEGQRILKRFDAAVARLDEAKVLDLLLVRETLNAEQLRQLDVLYFAAGVACPFLEEGACVIHAERPLACREFIVSSDPKHCARPGSGKVRQIEVAAKVSLAVAKTDVAGWVPLVMARHFVSQHRERVGKEVPRVELTRILGAL